MRQAELRLHFRNEAADEYLKMKLTTTRHVASDWARVTLTDARLRKQAMNIRAS